MTFENLLLDFGETWPIDALKGTDKGGKIRLKTLIQYCRHFGLFINFENFPLDHNETCLTDFFKAPNKHDKVVFDIQSNMANILSYLAILKVYG